MASVIAEENFKNYLIVINLNINSHKWLVDIGQNISRVNDEVDLDVYGKTVLCIGCSVVSNLLRHHGLQPSRLLCPWGFSRQEYWSGLPGAISNREVSEGNFCKK